MSLLPWHGSNSAPCSTDLCVLRSDQWSVSGQPKTSVSRVNSCAQIVYVTVVESERSGQWLFDVCTVEL